MTPKKETCSGTAFFPLQAQEKEGDFHWRMARDRVLRYLDAFGIPAVRSVDLSARVLKEARKQTEGDGQAVATAMRILLRILDEESYRIAEGDLTGHAVLNIASVPVLNRGKMVPEELDFSTVKRFYFKIRKRIARKQRLTYMLTALFLFFSFITL